MRNSVTLCCHKHALLDSHVVYVRGHARRCSFLVSLSLSLSLQGSEKTERSYRGVRIVLKFNVLEADIPENYSVLSELFYTEDLSTERGV